MNLITVTIHPGDLNTTAVLACAETDRCVPETDVPAAIEGMLILCFQ